MDAYGLSWIFATGFTDNCLILLIEMRDELTENPCVNGSIPPPWHRELKIPPRC